HRRADRAHRPDLSVPAAAALLQGPADLYRSCQLFLALPGPRRRRGLSQEPGRPCLPRLLGENTLRSDLSVSVPGLGSLLDHNGPIADAEANTARTFGADHSFYVINGTSTANKIIWHAFVTRDDVVLVDRNCHKSILHAITMTGAIPVYLT